MVGNLVTEWRPVPQESVALSAGGVDELLDCRLTPVGKEVVQLAHVDGGS